MKDVKKIICALDLSQHSGLVAEYAVALAKAFNAEIVAVYAAPGSFAVAVCGFSCAAKLHRKLRR